MNGLDGEETVSRDINGRFAPGSKGGPGRPKKELEEDYSAAIKAVVTVEEFGKVVTKALEQAKLGDRAAREWIGKFVVTEPNKTQVEDEDGIPTPLSGILRQMSEVRDKILRKEAEAAEEPAD